MFPELPCNTSHFTCLLNKTQLIQLNSDPEVGVLDKGHMHYIFFIFFHFQTQFVPNLP